MSVLVDTNVIIAFLVHNDKNNERANLMMKNIIQRQYGDLFVTDFIIDEVLTLLWAQKKRKDIVHKAYGLLQPDNGIFRLIITSEKTLWETWKIWDQFAEYPKRPLSFTDASLLAIAEEYGIDHIATFDEEFNGLISVLQ